MGKVIDLTGQVFGRLTVVGFAGIGSNRSARWECICLCGAVVVINSATLRNGRTQSCGCYHKQLLRERNTLHGLCKSTEYGSWSNMRKRCNRPNDPQYADYGGRGITVCEEWESFENFYKDMGPKPTPKHSIDRIDNDGNYCKDNCRWATQKQQNTNQRSNKRLSFNGETLTISEWADRLGISVSTLHSRLRLGWDAHRVLSTPSKEQRKRLSLDTISKSKQLP